MCVFNVICCFIVFLSLANSHPSKILPERLIKRQTDSFVVQANYGVQSEHLTATSPAIIQFQDDYNLPTRQENVTEHEILPTPNAWIGSNNFLTDPYTKYQGHLNNKQLVYDENNHLQIHKGNYQNVESFNGLSNFRTEKKQMLDNVVYGITTEPSAQIMSNKRIDYDSGQDVHSVQDLQKIIGSLVKGASKVHQVVKVPAIYEIHLQEEEPIHDKGFFNLPLPQWQKPQVGWNHFIPSHNKSPSHYYLPTHNKRRQNSRGMRYTTTTWNLPPKIQYFNNHLLDDRNGKYSHPRPFAANKWQQYWNNPSKYERHVQLPINPSSSSVALSSPIPYNKSLGNKNTVGTPDLSLYYAKKKEINAKEISSRNDEGTRRFANVRSNNNGLPSQRGRQTFQRGFMAPFSGMNYVIHVREKA